MLPDTAALEHAIFVDVDYTELLYLSMQLEEDSVAEATDGAAVSPNGDAEDVSPSSAPSKRAKLSASCDLLAPSMSNENDASPNRPRTRKKKYQTRIRNQKNAENGYHPSPKLADKLLKSAQPIYTSLNAADLPAAKGAYTALNKPAPKDPEEQPNIDKLRREGFQYIAANIGERSAPCPRPVFDCNGIIICHIAPSLQDPKYQAETLHLFDTMQEEAKSTTFSSDEKNHRRGNFPAVNFGYTLPNGFSKPINLNTLHHAEMLHNITSCPGFTALSNFQNSVFAAWNPLVYQYYKNRTDKVLKRHPELKKTSPMTVFPTTACNFCNVCCFKHRDTQNCPFGWCAVTALGRFDHTKGGHLILWELKLIIEFPHGWTILLPSATVTHSNTPVVSGGTRVSITQYCSGGLLRYVENGYCTEKALKQKDKDIYKERQALKETRWKDALTLLLTIDQLKERHVYGKASSVPTMFC